MEQATTRRCDMNNHRMKTAFEFLYLFARFEFAQKALGFHKGDGDAEPNWDEFANEISDRSDFNDLRIKEAVEYYFEQPPKKQVVRCGELKWEPFELNQGKLKGLFLYLRKVRNNLFHGGKFKGKYFEDPDRSNELIRNGIRLMDYCSDIYPDMKEAIDG